MERLYRAASANRRGIAQSGSAPALGAGCREFESLYPDHFFLRSTHRFTRLRWFVPDRCKAPVAQLIEHRPSKPRVKGSSPFGRATFPRGNEGWPVLWKGHSSKAFKRYGERSSVGRAPDCDSGGRGFNPRRSPHFLYYAQVQGWF